MVKPMSECGKEQQATKSPTKNEKSARGTAGKVGPTPDRGKDGQVKA